MPDTRSHRGSHPEDGSLFCSANQALLASAVCDLSWLLSRGYSDTAALKLVGDRFQLTTRQRSAVMRAAASDDACKRRALSQLTPERLKNARLGIDTFNCLITLEACLGGGVVVRGRDRALRDISSVHGTYRRVEETVPALKYISECLSALNVQHVTFYLDRPVSNSGRLGALIAEQLHGAPFVVETMLCDNVDPVIIARESFVASSDSWILDRAAGWFDLPAYVIATHHFAPRLVDLSTGAPDRTVIDNK